MLSRSCVRLSLASQLQHIGFPADLTGWVAASIFERGNELLKSAPNPRTRRNRIAGFNMVELAVSLAVLLILTAIAIPSLMRSFRTYQLNDAAARLSDMLKFTRFEAVRRNSLQYFKINNPSGTAWVVWTTPSSSSTGPLVGEKQLLVTGIGTLLPSGTPPSSASILAKLGATSSLDASKSGAAGSVTFDARGAVSSLSAAYVFYLG